MNLKTEELKNRIEAKKHQLLAFLAETKADTEGAVSEKRKDAEGKLKQLDEHLKDGWERLTDQVADKLNAWLKS